MTYEVRTTAAGECFPRSFIHKNNPAITIHHRYRTIHPIRPFRQKFLTHSYILSGGSTI